MTTTSVPDTEDQDPAKPMARKNRAERLSRVVGALLALACAAVVAAYVLWYTSSGHFPVFPDIQNDYIELGEAFLSGQTALLEQPDPRLAELDNPYEYSRRRDIPYHWDASYYQGKYYLYWGPVPALIWAAITGIGGAGPSASLLVLIAYLGLMFVAAMLLWHLSAWFGSAARLSVCIFILLGFFSLPMLFTIGQPRHYQASIMYGQFFLIAGLLAFVIYSRSLRPGWLTVAGVAWGMAFGSRFNLAISIAVFLAFCAVWLWRNRATASFPSRLAFVVVPLVLCMIGMGLYNLARFDDPFETGLEYQLTIPEFRQVSYSTGYVPSGLYIYLLYPLTGSQEFPFIQSAHFRPKLLPESIFVPDGREFDQITFGLMRTVPALWLLLVAIPLAPVIFRPQRQTVGSLARGASPAVVFSMLAAAAVGQFAFLLVFFYVAERYIVDFYVALVLCLAIIVWRAQQALQGSQVLRGVLWTLLSGLVVYTAAIGYFACFGVPVLVSIYYDPSMVADLASFWNSRYAALQSLLPGMP